MRLTRVRFTLLQLMIAVAVIACFLVLLGTSRGFLIICVLWSLALAAMFWGLLRGQRRRAWWCFGIWISILNCSTDGDTKLKTRQLGLGELAPAGGNMNQAGGAGSRARQKQY